LEATIAVLPGDGIGVEVTAEAVKVLAAVAEHFGHRFSFPTAIVGGVAIDETGTALPDETLKLCRHSAAILFGAIGGPKWDDPRAAVRPEQGLLALRKGLGLYANLRPVKLSAGLVASSTLKPEVVSGVDLIVVRELTGRL
jgi:3-isopropylmalate dehydrogenase